MAVRDFKVRNSVLVVFFVVSVVLLCLGVFFRVQQSLYLSEAQANEAKAVNKAKEAKEAKEARVAKGAKEGKDGKDAITKQGDGK